MGCGAFMAEVVGVNNYTLKELEEKLENLIKEEENARLELEKVVGKIPSKDEIERILGEINFMAGIRNLVITRIAVSKPRVTNLILVEAGDKKLVQVAVQKNRNVQQGSRKQANQKQASPPSYSGNGVPLTMMEVQMTLEGKTSDLYGFLESLQRKGLVSYPKSVRVSPIKDANIVSAHVVIDIILQR